MDINTAPMLVCIAWGELSDCCYYVDDALLVAFLQVCNHLLLGYAWQSDHVISSHLVPLPTQHDANTIGWWRGEEEGKSEGEEEEGEEEEEEGVQEASNDRETSQ